MAVARNHTSHSMFTLFRKSHLVDDFKIAFPDYNLTEVLSEFSLPDQLDEHRKITDDLMKKVDLCIYLNNVSASPVICRWKI